MASRIEGLDQPHKDQVSVLVSELLRWNKKINLTGHRDEAGIRVDLIEDGLALAEMVKGGAILDIGSGAGFPGLVLAIALPEAFVTMLEPRDKRVAFIHHMIRTLGLSERAEVVRGRAAEDRHEDPAGLQGKSFTTVTMRAVTDLKGSLRLAAPYVGAGGRVALPRGEKDVAEAEELGLRVLDYQVGEGERRILAIKDL